MQRAVYNHGSYGDLPIAWRDPTSKALIDFTDYSFEMVVAPFGGSTSFNKFGGITAQAPVDAVVPNPNVIVSWSITPNDELDTLADGAYIIHITATKDASPTWELFLELIIRVNAPNNGYCEKSDLLLGDLVLAETVNVYDYINATADEIDGELGQRYLLPLDLSAAPPWVGAKLKDINAKLATGRLLTALGAPKIDTGMQGLGGNLLKQARAELADIVSGKVSLTGVPIDPTSFRVTSPVIVNADRSAVDAMTYMLHNGHRRFDPFVPREPIWRFDPRCRR